MQTLYEVIKEHELFPKLARGFPQMVESAKTVEVIAWQDEFGIADRNVEVLEALEFFEKLLKKGAISREEYEEKIKDLRKTPASRTLGIAFAGAKKVSFRIRPTFQLAVHELGHIYFKEPDPIWSISNGGGEALLWLWLANGMFTTEEQVRRFHRWRHEASEAPDALVKKLCKKILGKLDLPCQPHLYCLYLVAGTIPPSGEIRIDAELLSDPNDPRWLDIKVSREGVEFFLLNLLEGTKWGDPWYEKYALALEIVQECPVCGSIPCVCY